jgi:hypothetical protein
VVGVKLNNAPEDQQQQKEQQQTIDLDDTTSIIPSVVSTPCSTPPSSPKKSPHDTEMIEMMNTEASFQKLLQIINAYPLDTYALYSDDNKEEKEVVEDMARPQSTVVPDLPTQDDPQEPNKTAEPDSPTGSPIDESVMEIATKEDMEDDTSATTTTSLLDDLEECEKDKVSSSSTCDDDKTKLDTTFEDPVDNNSSSSSSSTKVEQDHGSSSNNNNNVTMEMAFPPVETTSPRPLSECPKYVVRKTPNPLDVNTLRFPVLKTDLEDLEESFTEHKNPFFVFATNPHPASKAKLAHDMESSSKVEQDHGSSSNNNNNVTMEMAFPPVETTSPRPLSKHPKYVVRTTPNPLDVNTLRFPVMKTDLENLEESFTEHKNPFLSLQLTLIQLPRPNWLMTWR